MEQAKILEDNIDIYDGLIVIISSHGIKDRIVSSDYGEISTTALHRIFSDDYPKSRTIPRLFIYDCCDGSAQRDTDWRATDDGSDSEEYCLKLGNGSFSPISPINSEILPTFTPINTKRSSWYKGEDNPDHKLAVIHASNRGFQAKMHRDSGSYVISKFVEKIKLNFESVNKKVLYQIMDEIQNELHAEGKQLPVCTYNNRTRYIKFMGGDSKGAQRANHRNVYQPVNQDANDNL